MCIFKNAKTFLLTLVLVGILVSPTYAEQKKATHPPSSVGSANYYELKPSKDFISLGVKGYQQTTGYTCGPSAVMSLMHFYNMLSDADLTPATEMRIAQEMQTGSPSSPHFGTMPPDMAAWLEKNGFDVIAGENGTLKMLCDNLTKGIPTLVAWSDWGGHWAVVDGYYSAIPQASGMDRRDTIFLADSAAYATCLNSPKGITSFDAWRFNCEWYDHDSIQDKVFKGRYIIAVPHKK